MNLEEYILNNKDKSIRQISRELNISRYKVSKTFQKLNISKDNRMSEDTKTFLIDNKNLTSSKLSELTGVPSSTIRNFFQRNGIDKSVPYFNEKLEDVVKLYEEKKSSREVSKHYNVSHQTILKFLKDNNIDTTRKPTLSDEQYQFIVNNYNKMSSTMLANKFNVSVSLVTDIWTKNGLKGKKKKLYLFENEDYFSTINSFQKAYFLGLIASDGCLYKSKDNKKQEIIRLSLHNKDIDILTYFKKELGLSKPLNFYKDYVSLEIVSNLMFNDLKSYGLTERKTWSLNVDNIPLKFIHGFLLGYFDGDGSISWSKNNIANNRISKCRVSICGTEASMKLLSNFLKISNLDHSIVKDKRSQKYKGNFYSIVFVNTTQKYCFLKSIYSNNIYCLNRKQEKVKKFLFAVENNLTKRKENINAINKYKNMPPYIEIYK